jgi:putative heme-binding domain-containing protein
MSIMRRTLQLIVAVAIGTGWVSNVSGQDDPFAADIRATPALTPAQEQKSFHLPPGFKIELFAAEPEIQKPVNMAFDSQGRLWVSCTQEYPFPAPSDRPGRDTIRILEDTKGTGRADKMTVFADKLNIPIGLYPFKNGVIAFSIPNIYFLQDTDGDGKADKREVLYGPFDHLHDAHGLNNSFHRGFDGWIYANHGFSNHSIVRAKDGSTVDMQSGNTYRFRMDGSRIEQFTWGQVNPFGMTFDVNGDLFNADCHTKPIMLLLRNGYYDSFGKPHNGLGYVPPVMLHGHGSTAIAGDCQYLGENFPEAYRGNMFVGNVMTSRVNRDSLRYIGSSIRAVEEPDFIISDDPWFRPVDIQMGPDGAVYIADFYNKIIGHYEVPLNHPGRDRERGRIWRVTYTGPDTKPATTLNKVANLHTAGIDELIAALTNPSLNVRMRALDEMTDRIGASAIEPLRTAVRQNTDPRIRAYGAWALHRLAGLSADTFVKLMEDGDSLVRIHAYRIASETPDWSDEVRQHVTAGLADAAPLNRRAAVDALSRHPKLENISQLLAVRRRTPADDVHLLHAVKLALLETIKPSGILADWNKTPHDADEARAMAEISLALPNDEASAYLLEYLQHHPTDGAFAKQLLTHAAKYLPRRFDVERLVALVREKFKGEIDLQADLLFAVRNGEQQRGEATPPPVQAWGAQLAHDLVVSLDPGEFAWQSRTLTGELAPPWRLEARQSSDRVRRQFLSSFPNGEAFTGILRSPDFVIPPKLSFFLCGHLGFPQNPAVPENLVRLRLVGSNEIIAKALAPRNDVAQKTEWDLSAHAGQRGYLEVVDGLSIPSFAWLAIGRFEPAVISIPKLGTQKASARLRSASLLASALTLRDLEPEFRKIALEPNIDLETRLAAARTVLTFHPDPIAAALVEAAADPTIHSEPRLAVLEAVGGAKELDRVQLLSRIGRTLPQRLQVVVAVKLAESKEGSSSLLNAVEKGDLSAQVLRVASVKEKLLASRVEGIDKKINKLTEGLPPQQNEMAKLLEGRSLNYRRMQASSTRGREVFAKNCAQCHQIAGQGIVIGPQLDGIGERGMERLIEDVLDPNRNVDPNFKTTVYSLRDGRVLSGLFRRQEGKKIVIADSNGKEISFEESAVEQKQTSPNSLMPSNVGTSMPETDFYDLLAYLLSQRTRGGAIIKK